MSRRDVLFLRPMLVWGVLGASALFLTVALLLTGQSEISMESSGPASGTSESGPVDQRQYATARTLAALAVTEQEKVDAVMALRAADHELDKDFAYAIQAAAVERQTLSGPALEISRHIDELHKTIKKDEKAIADLPADTAAEATSDIADHRKLAQAQLALDNDDLDLLQIELARVGGAKREQIQQEFEQHRSIESQAATLPDNTATAALETPQALKTLQGEIRVYFSLRNRATSLTKAQSAAQEAMARLLKEKEALVQSPDATPPPAQNSPDAHNHSGEISSLYRLADQRKHLSELDGRISDLNRLVHAYSDWQAIVQSQRTLILNRIGRDCLSIVLIALGVFALNTFIRGLFRKLERDYQRLQHSRVLLMLLVRILGVFLIFVVIFGLPNQISTVIGLITAGITIALKDFIVSFLGWFVLMGRDGIRVGDWVEIDGVRGEVIEITTLRTVLLETGNWAAEGHSTGRRVVLMNKYAIDGKYFNFSTSGQWLWDEFVISIPPGRDLPEVELEKVRGKVREQTWNDTVGAEREWSGMAEAHGVSEFSTTPLVELRPSLAGRDLVIRYVTKAQNRFAMRIRPHQELMSILQPEIEPGAELFAQHPTR